VRERISRARRLFLFALAAVLLAGCGAGGTPTSGENGFVSGDGSIVQVAPEDRKPAPVVLGTRLGTNRPISSADHAGKVIVVNVWGSWCPPCRAEAKDLEAASRETAAVAQFIGLNTKDYSPTPAVAFVRAFGITYPQIYDPEGKALISLAGDLPPNAIPTTLVIDKQNRVAARIAGTVSKISLVALINDIAAGR
jgi:thiol-disulfide isomerase/thioredoxin